MGKMSGKPGVALLGVLLVGLTALAGIFPGRSQGHTAQDEMLPNVGVDEKLGARLPLDLAFTDQDGREVRLAHFFTGGPVILTLNYYSCPTLCPLIFRNLSNTISTIKGLSPSKDFRIVTVSIDPDETPARARAKAGETLRMLPGMPAPGERWPFLRGTAPEIDRLTKTVGVRYVRLEKNNFAHPAVIIVLTPEGRVARYLYGLLQSPADLKLALIEAAGGQIGSSTFLNRVILYCYHYDPAERKYALAAINIMKIAGGGILLLLGILLLALWRKEKRGTAAREEGRGGSS